jgi:hypothetical protein
MPLETVVERDNLPLDAGELELLAGEVALGAVQQLQQLAMVARHARKRQPRALPELVMIDLRDRRSEPLLQLRLRRLDVLALALQRPRLGEVELDRENPHITGAHGGIEPSGDQPAGFGV